MTWDYFVNKLQLFQSQSAKWFLILLKNDRSTFEIACKCVNIVKQNVCLAYSQNLCTPYVQNVFSYDIFRMDTMKPLT